MIARNLRGWGVLVTAAILASARDLGCVLTWVGTEAGGRKPSHPGIGQFLSGVVLVPPLGLKPAKLQEGSDLGVAMASACVTASPNGQGPAAEPSPLRAARGENTHCGASSTWSTVVTASALPGREERGTGYRQVGTRPGSREMRSMLHIGAIPAGVAQRGTTGGDASTCPQPSNAASILTAGPDGPGRPLSPGRPRGP